jgi:hypothetical protein
MAIPHSSKLTSRRGEPSYKWARSFADGLTRTTVTVHCGKCGKEEAMVWGTGNNPTYIKKHMVELGWLFDPFRLKSCVCPDCQRKRGGERPVAQSKEPKESKESKVLSFDPPASPLPRALTPDEKSKVRGLLDLHFDDTKCYYIDSYSDKRVGEECGVPWAAVQQIREFAYGPIREDERLVGIKMSIASHRDRLMKLAEDIEALRVQLNDLEEKIKTI